MSVWSHETLLVLGFAHLLGLLPGCHHSAARSAERRVDAATRITGDQLFTAGLYHAERGDLQRAEQYLNAAKQRGHDEARSVFWLVRVCIAGGRYHSALQHAAAYLRKQPQHWALRLVVASIHEALGDLARARSDLEAIVDAQPSLALAHYRLGMLYHGERSVTDLATHHLREYLRLSPEGAHGFEAAEALESLGTADVEGSQWEPGGVP